MTEVNSDYQKALNFDIQSIDKDFLENPFPTYKLLRENDPVHRNPDGTYFLTRYDDVVKAFRHPAMSSDKKIDFKPKFGDGPLFRHHTTSLVFNDDPYHSRVRKLMAEAFTPRKEKTPLEKSEDIEILRFLELGFDVHMIEMSQQSVAVDVPEDIEKAKMAIQQLGLQ